MALANLAPTYLAALEDELHLAIGWPNRQPGAPPQPGPGAASGNAADDLGEYYTMLAYHLGWTDGGTRGKRLRPLLCLLACAAAGGDWRQALPLAAAVELIHNFSLIHDDIQDNSPLRHGRPTVWSRWGQAQAINAGDAMFALAFRAPHRLAELGVPAVVILTALAKLHDTCLGLTQGQYLDMAFEQRQHVSVGEYLAMIEKKTAVLIAAATYLGACVAGAPAERLDHFYRFGLNLGLAFQLEDDLLGIWGNPAVTGKSAATDLEKRKKSLPVVYGLEHSAAFARAYAEPYRAGDAVADLAVTLEQLGARAEAEQRAHGATACAVAALAGCQPAEPAGQALRELTGQLLGRRR